MRTSRRRPTADGLTLVELLIVMGVLAVLMGIGVGAVARLDTGERRVVAQIKDALARARTFALSESAPARVVVDPRAGLVYGLGARRVGNWHFEGGRGDGWPVEARLEAARPVRDGVIGGAVELLAESSLRIPARPAFRSPDGFALDVWLMPDDAFRPMTILEEAGSWRVGFDRDGVLEVELVLRGPAETGPHRALYPDARLPADRWTRLSVAFDGHALSVALDGERLGADTLFSPPRGLVHAAAGAGIASGEEEAVRYRGRFDELRLSSVVRGDHEPLPAEIALEGPPRLVHLDPHGHLDPARHRSPVRLAFVAGDPPRRTSVEVGLLGHVRSWSEAVR